MVEFIQSYLRVIFNDIPFKTPRINPYIKDVKPNPDGSISYTLVYPDPPKWFVGEYMLKKDPEETAQ